MYTPSILAGACIALCMLHGCSRSKDPDRTADFKLADARIRADSLNLIFDTCLRFNNEAFYTDWYLPDACSFPEGTPRVCGREAIAKFYWNHGDNRSFRIRLEAEKLTGGPEEMVEMGNYLVSTAGAALDKGKFILTWARDTDGRWKIRYQIWNSDIPHAAPPDTLSSMEG